MRAEEFIRRQIRRGSRHVRFLALSEGSLGLALFIGWWFFLEIILDHLFSLSQGTRAALLVLLGAITILMLIGGVALPIIRSINRLYIAKRVEFAFPDFKNSLVTYIQMEKAKGDEGMLQLVAHQAAKRFERINVDVVLDSERFVKLGYTFVILVILAFVYTIASPKSVGVSFLRAIYPWEDIAPPTYTHIRDVTPGNARIPQGSDLAVSATISRTKDASIRWSRDGELWQSVPMEGAGRQWHGSLAHVEADLRFYVAAGDAASARYNVITLPPPVVESVSVDFTYPPYTRLAPHHIDEGNIEAPVGTEANVTIKSNKPLRSVSLKLPKDTGVNLRVDGSTARGAFKVADSGRYSVLLTDADSLSPARPVQYDIAALADRAPKVSVEGPSGGAKVKFEEPVRFRFDAADDYGLTRLVFHFETNAGNADVKNFILPGDSLEAARVVTLVPQLLGARPGDTVSYYLEGVDNRSPKANSARTASYSFEVEGAPAKQMAAFEKPSGPPVETSDSLLPGRTEKSSGTPKVVSAAPSKSTGPSDKTGTKAAEPGRDNILKMLRDDKPAWDKIARHFAMLPPDASEQPQAPLGAPGTEQKPPEGARGTAAPGQNASENAQGRDNEQPTPPPASMPDVNAQKAGDEENKDSSAPQGSEQAGPQGTGESSGTGGESAGGQTGETAGQEGSPEGIGDAKAAKASQGASKIAKGTPQVGESDKENESRPDQESEKQASQDQGEADVDSSGGATASAPGGTAGKKSKAEKRGTKSPERDVSDVGKVTHGGSTEDDEAVKSTNTRTNPVKKKAELTQDSPEKAGENPVPDETKQLPMTTPAPYAGEAPPKDDAYRPEEKSGAGAADRALGQGGQAESHGAPSTSASPHLGPGGEQQIYAHQNPGPQDSQIGGPRPNDKPTNAESQRSGSSQSAEERPSPSDSKSDGAQSADSGAENSSSPGGASGGSPLGSKGSSSSTTAGSGAHIIPDSARENMLRDMGELKIPGGRTATRGLRGQIAAARSILNRLSSAVDANVVDKSLLQDLGWQPSDLVTFVRRYQEALREVEPWAMSGDVELKGDLDAGEITAGERTADSVGSVDTGGEKVKKDEPKALKDLPREEVSPQYKRLVDEYYRGLSQAGE